jgi:DhnA family fructose-bisphosphate aldolase class Ia
MIGKQIRLNKLFSNGSNAIVVAIDHGQTFGPMDGLVNFTHAAENLKEADGVLLTAQMARFSGTLFQGKGSPTFITRINWNTVHCEPWHYQEAYTVKSYSVANAIAAGADIVLASLVLKTGSEKHDAKNVEVFAALAEEASHLGIPLIGEVFPAHDLRSFPDEFHDYIRKTCRIICELGADAIKTFYTGDRFTEVCEGVPIPIFALGAEKLNDPLDALNLAQKSTDAGARGVVFGRNVVQAENPTMFLRGLKAVVQAQLTPVDAAHKYGLLMEKKLV